MNPDIGKNPSRLRFELDGKPRPVFCPPSAEKSVEEVLEGREYPCRLLPDDFRPKVILDVGAHVGGATLYFHQQYPEAQIFSYEPCQEFFKYLELNTHDRPNIKLHPFGLYNQSTELPLYKAPYSTNSLVRPQGPAAPDFDLVKLVRASEELACKELTNISILKLDVEGCELEILVDIFTNVRDLFVICIFVEYHSAATAGYIRELLGNYYEIHSCHSHTPELGVLMLLDKRCAPLMNSSKRV